MAKSQIIKDLANGTADTQTALKRTKVLLQGFNKNELLQWINWEIEGYPNVDVVPEYRKIRGQLYGNYFKGSMASHMKYSNVSLPLGGFTPEEKDKILTAIIVQGIEALKHMVQSGDGTIVKPLPADFYPALAIANKDPYMIISSANVVLNTPQVLNIFSRVENRLLDILCYLENQFGNLDELDIDIESKSPEELESITAQIYVIINNDNSIKIGDNNEMKDVKVETSGNK